MIPRARSLSRKQTAAATGDGVARVPAERRARAPEPRELVEAGDAAGGDRLDRPGRDEVDAHAARPEVAREVARDALERRLGDAHPVVDRPGDRWRRSRGRRPSRRARAASSSGATATASAFSENALVWNAVIALAAGVSRKPPPSASAGANAIACSTPSSAPQREPSSAATPASCSGSLTSSSSTSGGVGRCAAARCGQAHAAPEAGQHDLARPPPAPGARPRRRSSRASARR